MRLLTFEIDHVLYLTPPNESSHSPTTIARSSPTGTKKGVQKILRQAHLSLTQTPIDEGRTASATTLAQSTASWSTSVW